MTSVLTTAINNRQQLNINNMQIKHIFLILLLSSCGLFRKTTKTNVKDSFDLSKETEAQIYSYWKDSIFHQYEVIREQVDQAKA